ncbi:MAG: hypothetical protein ABMA64_35740, partial [Myxococcota bacterium]
MWWFLGSCATPLPELRQEPVAPAPEPPEPPGDTGAWFVDTGGEGTAGCLSSCDLACDGSVDEMLVVVRQPAGSELAFIDLAAALAVAEPGAVVTMCPGTYPSLATLERDLALVAWDSGVERRPVLVPSEAGAVVTVGSGASVTLIGLTVSGGCDTSTPPRAGGSG